MVVKLLSVCILFLGWSLPLHSQCGNWNESPRKEEAENAHSNYRSALKINDYALAYQEWSKVFEIAPAADGRRDFHFMDGIKIFKHQLKNETSETKKAELKEAILKLYDQCAECYEKKGIIVSSCRDDACYQQKAAFVLGRKAFDMYYELKVPYDQNLAAFEAAISKGGNNVEYIVFEPVANIVVHLYNNGKLDAMKARELHDRLVVAADWSIKNNDRYKAYYESSKARMLARFAEIENKIFDCAYFKQKLKSDYDENPDDPETVKYIYNKLLQQGCDRDDPFLVKMQVQYEKFASEENARIQAEFEANNPAVVANKLYKEEDFEGAIEKYKEALEKETDADPDKKAQYYFNIASIELRKLVRLQSAKANALKAAELRKDWGQPYLLIGDIYAKAANSCGENAFEQRIIILAALDKYQYARSLDESAREEADRKIAIYSANKPSKDDAFMRGYQEGEILNTGCWIGESVRLRVQ